MRRSQGEAVLSTRSLLFIGQILEINSFDLGSKGGMQFLDSEGFEFWLFAVAAHGVDAGFGTVLLVDLRFTMTLMKLLLWSCLSYRCSGISGSLYPLLTGMPIERDARNHTCTRLGSRLVAHCQVMWGADVDDLKRHTSGM